MTVLSLAALYERPVAAARTPPGSVRPTITRTVSLAYIDSRPLTKASREVAVRTRRVLQDRATTSVWQAKPL